jgi:tripartite ATP-independent transporter DctP family solute receptor
MKAIDRRIFLGGAGAAATLIASPYVSRAVAAEFNFKAGTNQIASHPNNVRLKEAFDRILAQSNGRLDIKLFPNSQLGGESDLLSQVRSGAVQIFTIGGLVISSVVPVAAINGTAFAFKDYEQVWRAMDGKLGAHIRQHLAKAGLYTPSRMWDLGFRQITTSNRPITKVEDLGGLKIRVPGAAAYTNTFKALGAAPVTMQYPEVYSALQTKVVDGQENPLALISTSKFYEVQKFCSLSNHIWDGFWVLINQRAWGRLPSELQEIAEKNLNQSGTDQRNDLAKLDIDLRDELKSSMSVNTTEPASFRQKLIEAGYYSDVRSKYGDEAWSLLQEYSGPLG